MSLQSESIEEAVIIIYFIGSMKFLVSWLTLLNHTLQY